MILNCINMFLDPQFIVRQECFQHKILNWSTNSHPLLIPIYKQGRKEGARTMRILSINQEAAVQRCYLIIIQKISESFHENTPLRSSANSVTVLKQGSTVVWEFFKICRAVILLLVNSSFCKQSIFAEILAYFFNSFPVNLTVALKCIS